MEDNTTHYPCRECNGTGVSSDAVRYCTRLVGGDYDPYRGVGVSPEPCGRMLKRTDREGAPVLPPHPRPCGHCAQEFRPKRFDALYCSTRCRVAAHRAKRRAA